MRRMEQRSQTRGREQAQASLLLSLEMFETGVDIMRARICRENPELSEEDVERRVVEWLGNRPPDGPA